MPFQKGQSGNPAGMKPGTLHKLTIAARKIASAKGPGIVKKIAEDAEGGDRTAQQLFLKYLYPRSKVVDGLTFVLPKVDGAADVPGAIKSVVEAMASGALTPSEASAIISSLEAYGRSVVANHYAERLEKLEALFAERANDAG
jgi:hypothetical protein